MILWMIVFGLGITFLLYCCVLIGKKTDRDMDMLDEAQDIHRIDNPAETEKEV